MNLQSPKVTVEKSSQELFDSLNEVKNFKKLMPDNIVKFEVIDNDGFVFGLNGMPEIELKIKEKNPPNKIVLVAAGGKLSFSLLITIETISDNSSTVQLDFEGEFNAMMAMMVKGPISKFIETLVGNMNKL